MASFASKELANRARPTKTSRTARFTHSDTRLKPAGRRGSTMVTRTFAHVATTTTNPNAKRNASIAAFLLLETTGAFACLHASDRHYWPGHGLFRRLDWATVPTGESGA